MSAQTFLKRAVTNEPVALTGAVIAAYHAVVAYLLIAGIYHATVVQVTSLEAAVVAIAAIPVTLIVRNKVTPVSKV